MTPTGRPPLWHYTCGHGHTGIGVHGLLQPVRQLLTPAVLTAMPDWMQPLFDLIWLTDLDHPTADALGLTSHTLRCDHTTHRYRVAGDAHALPYTQIQTSLEQQLRTHLEAAPRVRLRHWWVAYAPVSVTYDPEGAALYE